MKRVLGLFNYASPRSAHLAKRAGQHLPAGPYRVDLLTEHDCELYTVPPLPGGAQKAA